MNLFKNQKNTITVNVTNEGYIDLNMLENILSIFKKRKNYSFNYVCKQ